MMHSSLIKKILALVIKKRRPVSDQCITQKTSQSIAQKTIVHCSKDISVHCSKKHHSPLLKDISVHCSKDIFGSHSPSFLLSIAIVFEWWVIVQPNRFLVKRWVVQAVFGCGDLLRERLGVRETAAVSEVVWHGWQCVLHDDVILVWCECVVAPAGGFGRVLIVPVHVFVIHSSGGVYSTVVPVRVSRRSSPCIPVRMFRAPFTPTRPCHIWRTAVVGLPLMKFWLPFFWQFRWHGQELLSCGHVYCLKSLLAIVSGP